MALRNTHLLVIDDDEDVLVALRLLFKPIVKEVVTTRNPNQIVSLMRGRKFDAVILDMNFNGDDRTRGLIKATYEAIGVEPTYV